EPLSASRRLARGSGGCCRKWQVPEPERKTRTCNVLADLAVAIKFDDSARSLENAYAGVSGCDATQIGGLGLRTAEFDSNLERNACGFVVCSPYGDNFTGYSGDNGGNVVYHGRFWPRGILDQQTIERTGNSDRIRSPTPRCVAGCIGPHV